MAKIGKSIWAVVAGFLAVFILSVITDLILETTGVFPTASEGLFVTWMLLLALFYRSVYSVVGGYITAKLAPHKPMKHVWILAWIGFGGSLIGVIVNYIIQLGPSWYPILLALLTIPCVLLGGKLARRK